MQLRPCLVCRLTVLPTLPSPFKQNLVKYMETLVLYFAVLAGLLQLQVLWTWSTAMVGSGHERPVKYNKGVGLYFAVFWWLRPPSPRPLPLSSLFLGAHEPGGLPSRGMVSPSSCQPLFCWAALFQIQWEFIQLDLCNQTCGQEIVVCL